MRQSTLLPTEDKYKGSNSLLTSVFFRFKDENLRWYHYVCTTTASQPTMMIINIFYFFVMRNNFLQCINRLRDSVIKRETNRITTLKQSQKMIEMVFIMYVATCIMMPGGHENFQLWYIDMVPFCMMLTDIHPIFFFKVYLDIFPAFLDKPKTLWSHHIFLIVLMYGLLNFKHDETSSTYGRKPLLGLKMYFCGFKTPKYSVSIANIIAVPCGAYIFYLWTLFDWKNTGKWA